MTSSVVEVSLVKRAPTGQIIPESLHGLREAAMPVAQEGLAEAAMAPAVIVGARSESDVGKIVRTEPEKSDQECTRMNIVVKPT